MRKRKLAGLMSDVALAMAIESGAIKVQPTIAGAIYEAMMHGTGAVKIGKTRRKGKS